MSGDEISSEDVERALDEIHGLHTDSPAGVCPSCYRLADSFDPDDDGLVNWPCPTVQAVDRARAVLAALAGRLLPAGGEERTEWALQVDAECSWYHDREAVFAERARRVAWGRENPGVVISRKVWTGPWLPVEEGTQDGE